MQKLTFELSSEEKLTLEYRTFEYHGLQINLDQFLQSGYDFNEDHYNRLIDTLVEKYAALQTCLIGILAAKGHKTDLTKPCDYQVVDYTLRVSV